MRSFSRVAEPMENEKRPRPQDDFATFIGETAAVSSGPGSSSSAPLESPTVVDLGTDSATVVDAIPSSSRPQGFLADQPLLQPGVLLAQRYQIMQLLGEGGMGAVYKAKDRELDRMVALKVIVPTGVAIPRSSNVSSKSCGFRIK